MSIMENVSKKIIENVSKKIIENVSHFNRFSATPFFTVTHVVICVLGVAFTLCAKCGFVSYEVAPSTL